MSQEKKPRGGASYLCPQCGKPSHVVITRREEDGAVRRVRQCLGRGEHKFQTIEREES